MANVVDTASIVIKMTRAGSVTAGNPTGIVDTLKPSEYFRAQTFTNGAGAQIQVKGITYDHDSMTIGNA